MNISSSVSSSFETTSEQASGLTCSRSAASDVEKSAGSGAAEGVDGQRAEFRAWMAKYFQREISGDRREEVEHYAAQFEQLIQRAEQSNAEAAPEEFLRGLSSDEREVLRHMHGLVDAIEPGKLSQEGAVNLLRSPGSARDVDRDGFQMVGKAKTWTFPPPDAPAAVKQAWEDTTRGLSEKDVFLLQGTFLPISVPGYESPSAYQGADTDYLGFVRKALASAEYGRQFDEPWQVETRSRQIALLKDLIGHLEKI